MPRLAPLNPATCPGCGKKNTKRVGFSPEKRGSLWQCFEDACRKRFIVPTLALVRKPG